MPPGECTSTTDRLAGGDTGRLFLTFGGPVCADRISYCPLDRVLTYKNLIYLLNLQLSKVGNKNKRNTCASMLSTLAGRLHSHLMNEQDTTGPGQSPAQDVSFLTFGMTSRAPVKCICPLGKVLTYKN